MKRLLLMLLCVPLLLGAAPSRTKTYVAGTTIENEDVTENEDNIFSYLQAGVDTLRANAVTSTAILNGTITNDDLGSNAVTSASITDATIVAADLASDAVTEAKLKAVDSPADEEFLTYETTTGDFEWQAQTTTVADRVHRTAGDVTTTSTSLVDFTGASITLTTGANPVLVGFAAACFNNSTTDRIRLNVDIDGAVKLGTIGLNLAEVGVVSEYLNCSFVMMTEDLTAGSHTFKLQWFVTGGTATMECNSFSACNFWVAEVTD